MIPSVNGSIHKYEGQFVFPDTYLVCEQSGDIAWLDEVLSVLEDRLRQSDKFHQFRITYGQPSSADAAILLQINPALSEGAYKLSVSPRQIAIKSGSESGAAFALTTLYWMIRENHGVLPCEEIMDSPRYSHRGFLLDSSRHFLSVSTVKSMIEQASLRKLNRLHWHLSDDQGYRIESKCFPLLNTVGSWRKEENNDQYGGYYSWEEIRDIIAYARARGMEIIPEIDLPGHVSSLIASYPQLSCSEEPLTVPSTFGIHKRILCVGKDQTLDFVKKLLSEVCELFPYPYFHIGGDEAPKDEWKKCPHCQKRIQSLGLKSEEHLQAWFTTEIMNFLKEKGKTGIAWNETLKSGMLPEDTLIQYWAEEGADAGYCENAFSAGRKCIYSFSSYLYLDTMPALAPLRKVFSCREIVSCGNPIPEKNILGWEGALWAEFIPDQHQLEYMAFPRLLAIAEKTWNPAISYDEFSKNCRKEIHYLNENRIHTMSFEEADPHGEKQIQQVIDEWRPMVQAVKDSEQYRDVIREIICSKLEGSFEPDEIEDLKHRLFD